LVAYDPEGGNGDTESASHVGRQTKGGAELMQRLLQAITALCLGLAFATVTLAQGTPGSVPGADTPGVPPAPTMPPPPPEGQLKPENQLKKDTGKKQTPKSEKKHKRKKHRRSPKPVQP
jgi:hypothetical protein